MTARVLQAPKFYSELIEQTVGELFFQCCDKYGERIFQIDAITGVQETFTSVKKRSIRVAMALQSKNISYKDVIAFCTYNHLDSIIPLMASMFLGAKIATLDPTLSPTHTKHLLELTIPKILFVDESAVPLIEKSLSDQLSNIEIVVIGKSNKYLEFIELLKIKNQEDTFKPLSVNSDEIALILFSSGTTGSPKGISISHRSLIYNFLIYRGMGMKANVLIHFTTMYWISAFLMTALAFLEGSTKILCQKFEADLALKAIEKYQVTHIFISPYIAHNIVSLPNKDNYDLSSMDFIAVGGGVLSAHLYSNLSELFKNSHISNVYGLTEVGCITSTPIGTTIQINENQIVSCGKLLPGVQLKIIDLETNKILEPNQKGEIYVKTLSIMQSYYNLDSSNIFDNEGFVKSGDIGYYDENESIYVIDRIKEMFKYQSWHLLPASIEMILLEHKDIKEAVVFGLPDKVDGELPAAFVVLQNNSEITVEDIVNFVNERVHDRERLRGGITLVENIPRTPSGKVIRQYIRDYAIQMKG